MYVMKPNPRDRPVMWSCMIWLSTISPNCSKYCRKSSSRVSGTLTGLTLLGRGLTFLGLNNTFLAGVPLLFRTIDPSGDCDCQQIESGFSCAREAKASLIETDHRRGPRHVRRLDYPGQTQGMAWAWGRLPAVLGGPGPLPYQLVFQPL